MSCYRGALFPLKQIRCGGHTCGLLLQIVYLSLVPISESAIESARLLRGWPVPRSLAAQDGIVRTSLSQMEAQNPHHEIGLAWPAHASALRSGSFLNRTRDGRFAGSAESAVCFKISGFMGIGDRLRRTAWLAHIAWERRQPLRLDLGSCHSHSIYGMLFKGQTGFDVPGLGQLIPWRAGEKTTNHASECLGGLFGLNLLGPNQDVLPPERNLFDQLRGSEAEAFLQPAVQGLVEALQAQLKPELHAMAARMIQSARDGGKKVIGVHLRLGNGEANFEHDGRHIGLTDAMIVARVEDAADRVARARSWSGYRILLVTDTPRVQRAWLKLNPDLVVVRKEGFNMFDGQGFVEPHEEQDPELCRNSLEAAWVDATALGDVDVLLTPNWSELDLIPKTMVLARGADWCRDAASYTLDGAGTKSFMQASTVTCVSR